MGAARWGPHTACNTAPRQGLDALGYKEHIDYDVVQSNLPAFGKAIVRVNVFRNHRQVRGSGSVVAARAYGT